MNEKLIWLVRLIGLVVFLVLIFLLMSLHARLVKMNQEAGSAPATSRGPDCERRIADCETEDDPMQQRRHLPVQA